MSRLSLDRLRSAAHRRESYHGHWLPEPIVTPAGESDPLAAVWDVANPDKFSDPPLRAQAENTG